MRTSKAALWIWIVACLLACGGGAWAGRQWFSSPRPLGVPLPAAQQPIFTLLPATQANDVSWMNRTCVEPWLEFMAPQPDGLPPLRWDYHSELADYTILHPHGTETTMLPSADANGVITEAWGVLHYGWPVKEFTYQMVPRKSGETVTEFMARYEHELMNSGGTLIGNTEPLDLPTYQFQHFEYQEAARDGQSQTSRYVFIGPLGSRVLVLTYKCDAPYHEQARPVVLKIMRSFEPGWELKKLMQKENPQYGELAGTALDDQPTNLMVAK